MDVEEVKQKKQYLSEKIARLLGRFEDETGLQVSEIEFVRRSIYDELGSEMDKSYIVEINIGL